MNIMESISQGWASYRKRRALIYELHALDCGDMQRLIKDTGLSFADLLALAKTSGDAAKLLQARMIGMSLDPKKVDGAVLRDMQRCCSLCASKVQCAQELEDKPKQANWPRYCPNKDTLEALSQMQRLGRTQS